jgi:hypothetical protein
VLLTISGIAETHPQALTLATYLIQLGWLLLQIQGAKLAQRFGTHGQCLVLFNVWFFSTQLLDVHRRFLKTGWLPLSAGVSENVDVGRPSSIGSSSSIGDGAETRLAREQIQSFERAKLQAQGVPITSSRVYYMTLLCNAMPVACDLSTYDHSLVSSSSLSSGSSRSLSSTSSSGGIAGMKEMEHLVLFEIAAGFLVSAAMVLVWLAMALRQGAEGSTTHARVQRVAKTAKGQAHSWRGLVAAKVDAFVEGLKFRVE